MDLPRGNYILWQQQRIQLGNEENKERKFSLAAAAANRDNALEGF